jgi:DNA-binding response OmpR family regulator
MLRLKTPEGSTDFRSLQMKIFPPWYLSPLAIYIYVFLLIGLIFISTYIIRIRLKEKKAKEKISYFINIAHDLKTPLTLIKAPLTKLVSNNKLDIRDKKYLNMAVNNAEKINSYFNQLLDFQRSDMNKMELNPVKSDLIAHMKEIGLNFQPLFSEMNLDFKILTEESTFEFYYDREIIEKIFHNLLSNAVKYTPSNGKIRLKIRMKNTECIIKVCDNGIGIPARQQKQIFKRYFRATNAIQSYKSGTGVGLMLVKQLVDLVGGKISFISNEGAGTEFIVTLRIHNSPQQNRATEEKPREYVSVFQVERDVNEEYAQIHNSNSETKNSGSRSKILIAEDNQEMRNLLFDSFKEDFHVITANNGMNALNAAKKYDISLVISDIMMPEMDGRVLCNELKNNPDTCHIPVILLTALSDKDYRIEGYESGADDYIEKPFDINVLRCRMDNLIASRKVLRDKFLMEEGKDIPPEFERANDYEDDFILRAKKLIEDNIENPDFTIDDFSSEMMVSRSLLYRKIKAKTDLSPIEFLTYSRMRYATKLLQNTQLSIKEISYKCGFSDPRYFSTIFKKHFNTTPTSFFKKELES